VDYIKFIPLYGNCHKLEYATALSSGIDLKAYIKDADGNPTYTVIDPCGRLLINTGYSCKLHQNFEGQIRSKSGLALKHGIQVLNSPGTIDADYEQAIGVILHNTDAYNHYRVNDGDKIAQFVISPVSRDPEYLSENKRNGGFGSTGK